MRNPAKWLYVGLYIICIFVTTPFLPNLIKFATYQWSNKCTQSFVLRVEIIIALIIIVIGVIILIIRKKKSNLFSFMSIVGIFLASVLLYFFFLPNPYEFTHFPEYAILSMLIVQALNKDKARKINFTKEIKNNKNLKFRIMKNFYFLSIIITVIIGTVDEIYQYFLPHRFFSWYDILLNIGGGILGLLIYWGMKK